MTPLLRCLALSALAVALPCAAAPARAAPPPAGAEELAALPGGGWLALGRDALLLVDAAGSVRDRFAVRGESLDVRASARAGLAALIDSNTQQVVLLGVDLAGQRLQPLPPLPPATQTLSAVCLHRDAQGHDHVFVIGENGLARQWVLRGDTALALRELAVAPEAEQCRVDDRQARLFVSEPGGVWAHRAEAEGPPTRDVVALAAPHGPLAEGGGPLAVLPGGLAVGDAGRASVLLLRPDAATGHWRREGAVALPRDRRAEQLQAAGEGASLRLWTRDDDSGRWSRHAVAGGAVRAGAPARAAVAVVQPRAQTAAVASYADAADDPALWVHPGDRERSRVLGTDKTRGLGVYDLQGRELQFLEVGRVNNVDVRQAVQLGDARVDIAAASQRDDNAVVVFLIDGDGRVAEAARLPTGLSEVYGLCLYRSPQGLVDVFVNDKDGRFVQLRLTRQDGRYAATLRRKFRVASQPEGCVVDDRAARLFLGEEKRGVWTLPVEPPAAGAPDGRRLILPVGPQLAADVEGLGLHHGEHGSYLVASSQGDHSFVVLDAAPPFQVRGRFRIGMNLEAGIDGVSETDGLEVQAGHFGPLFPQGLLVVQDGFKRLPDGPQNYKYVSWADVMQALDLR